MSQTVRQTTKRWGGIWFGGITAFIGIITASIGINTGNQKAGYLCGSVFEPESLTAEYVDAGRGGNTAVTSCNQQIAALTVPTWLPIVLGIALIVIAFVGAVIVWTIGNSRSTVVSAAPAAPSVATQLEDLTRLKDQGIISAEEFDAKRAELLDRL
jgi:hypothetical protein